MTKDEQTWLNNNCRALFDQGPEDVTDDAPTTADARTLFVPLFLAGRARLFADQLELRRRALSTTTKGFHNNYLSDGTLLPTSWGWRQLDQIDWDAGRHILQVQRSERRDHPGDADSTGYTYGPNAGCPDAVMRLTNNQGNVGLQDQQA